MKILHCLHFNLARYSFFLLFVAALLALFALGSRQRLAAAIQEANSPAGLAGLRQRLVCI
jgi:hypothetical protein